MPRKYELTEVGQEKKLKTIKQCNDLYPIFAPLVKSLAECLKKNSLRSGKLKFSENSKELSLEFINELSKNGEVLVEIFGCENAHLGTPYYSSWNGLFYRLPSNKKKPYVKNGESVKKGSTIGIIYLNKNEQFVLSAPASGVIRFPNEDKELSHAVKVKIYEESEAEKNTPLFYLN